MFDAVSHSTIDRQRGFSLIELLVVIGIIGLVTGIGASFAASVQRNTRNAQRQSDLNIIKSVLQQYYADNNFYPDTFNLGAGGEFSSCTGNNITPPPTCNSKKKIYLKSLPKDPQASATQYYSYKAFRSSAAGAQECTNSVNQGKCHYYQLCASLENPAVPVSCTGGNFLVTPL
ncbi:MAG TPA: type II secretion system protein [Patescibacteria group bacterium]|nr:type II secretion system protein [Patescibacteria group bacterium]